MPLMSANSQFALLLRCKSTPMAICMAGNGFGVDCCGARLRCALCDQVQVPACCPLKVNWWVKVLWLLWCHGRAQLPDVQQRGWAGKYLHILSCSTRWTDLH